MTGHTQITKVQFYRYGAFSNPRLVRVPYWLSIPVAILFYIVGLILGCTYLLVTTGCLWCKLED